MAGITTDEIKQRIQKLRRELAKNGLAAAFLTAPADVRYFSGFTGSDSSLLVTAKKRWIVTDSRYTEEAEKSAPLYERALWKKHPAEFAAELLKKEGIGGKLGVSKGQLTLAWAERLKKARLALEALDDQTSALRAVKSAAEVAGIRRALKVAQDAFTALRGQLKAGMTEMEVRLELEWQMQRRGAAAAAFETIVACGANASLPHAHAGTRKIAPGKPLLIDFGACVNGYNSDLTRTLFAGTIPQIWLRRYEATLAAQAAGIRAIRAGAAAAKADEAARAVLQDAGLVEYFTHSLGHGAGLEVHEAPRLSVRSAQTLVAGNVVTVEPGVYFPGQGGIRIEDMVLVTAQGARVLSRLPKSAAEAVF